MRKARRKLKKPVTLFAGIEVRQHEAIREIAFKERRSMADVVREALDLFIQEKRQSSKR